MCNFRLEAGVPNLPNANASRERTLKGRLADEPRADRFQTGGGGRQAPLEGHISSLRSEGQSKATDFADEYAFAG